MIIILQFFQNIYLNFDTPFFPPYFSPAIVKEGSLFSYLSLVSKRFAFPSSSWGNGAIFDS